MLRPGPAGTRCSMKHTAPAQPLPDAPRTLTLAWQTGHGELPVGTVEARRLWLPLLGPAATALLELFADALDSGVTRVSATDAAASIGLAAGGSRRLFERTVARLVSYQMITADGDHIRVSTHVGYPKRPAGPLVGEILAAGRHRRAS